MSAVVDARSGRILAWRDEIPLHYEYTAGIAGEVFLKALGEGRILASKCTNCGDLRVPPRTYCLECRRSTRIDVELYHSARVAALSTTMAETKGARAPRRVRDTYGYMTFEGVSGGMLHRTLSTRGREPKLGDPATPVFVPRDKRRGSVLDLQGFRIRVSRAAND